MGPNGRGDVGWLRGGSGVDMHQRSVWASAAIAAGAELDGHREGGRDAVEDDDIEAA